MQRGQTLQSALVAALDAAAPDEESWKCGWATFWSALQNDCTLHAALVRTLNATAPDQEFWMQGYEAFGNIKISWVAQHMFTRVRPDSN